MTNNKHNVDLLTAWLLDSDEPIVSISQAFDEVESFRHEIERVCESRITDGEIREAYNLALSTTGMNAQWMKAFVKYHVDVNDECYSVIMGEIDNASSDEMYELYDRVEEYILTLDW